LAESNAEADPMSGLYASCDRFVATLFKATETDLDIPWGNTNAMYSYFKSSDKWDHVTDITSTGDPESSGMEAGDVLIKNGHVALYIGTPENASEIGLSPGEPAVADASIYRRVGFVGPFEYMDNGSQQYGVFRCTDCG